MKKVLPLALLVVVSAVLRLYKIGDIPYGYNWDETSIIYNAWGIALWHRDEWANLIPLAFRSFGDYKAPLLFYMLAVPFKLFGVIEPLIRIYSAIFGVITVICTYLIALELFGKNKKTAFISSLLVAVSPWAVNFSRVGFEANIGLGLVSLAVLFFLKGISTPKWQIISMLTFSASLYAYHSTKIAVPILLVSLGFSYWQKLKKNIKSVIVSGAILLISAAPLAYTTIFGNGFERGHTMIFFNDDRQLQKPSLVFKELFQNIQNQFSSKFLIGGSDSVGLRHLTPGSGIIYVVELPFLIFGVVRLIQLRSRNALLILVWVVIGMMPALLSHQTPHAVRSLLMIPGLQLITGFGFVSWSEKVFDRKSAIRKLLVALPVLLLIVGISNYLQSYYDVYAKNSAREFQFGYRQALELASDLGRTRDKIIVTDTYGQPYVYVLLTNQITPEEFLAGALANYEFHSISWPYNKPNSVLVGTPEEIPPNDPLVEGLITIPGTNEVIFVVATTPK